MVTITLAGVAVRLLAVIQRSAVRDEGSPSCADNNYSAAKRAAHAAKA
jgi:hypothetical protein